MQQVHRPGLVVGVHSPEFEFEKTEENVRGALPRLEVLRPVAMDNDFSTWRAYGNRYWPRKYLIGQEVIIRFDHIGEGAYFETELHIRNLLVETGAGLSDIPVGGSQTQ